MLVQPLHACTVPGLNLQYVLLGLGTLAAVQGKAFSVDGQCSFIIMVRVRIVMPEHVVLCQFSGMSSEDISSVAEQQLSSLIGKHFDPVKADGVFASEVSSSVLSGSIASCRHREVKLSFL